MTDLDQKLLSMLTARWDTAAGLIADLHNECGAGRFKGDWTPGAVLAGLERLAVAGKAEFELSKGWRLMPDRPKETQRAMFQ